MTDEQTITEGERLFFDMSAKAQPVSLELLAVIRDMKPMPSPIVAAIACRYVGLYAAKAFLAASKTQDEKDAVAQVFATIDARLCVEQMLAGHVEVDEETIAAVMERRERRPLPVPTDDPTVFDIDAWEEKS